VTNGDIRRAQGAAMNGAAAAAAVWRRGSKTSIEAVWELVFGVAILGQESRPGRSFQSLTPRCLTCQGKPESNQQRQ